MKRGSGMTGRAFSKDSTTTGCAIINQLSILTSRYHERGSSINVRDVEIFDSSYSSGNHKFSTVHHDVHLNPDRVEKKK